jgi:D-glycero-D-manno-heptose 1,7-bisphosphate phosphatase
VSRIAVFLDRDGTIIEDVGYLKDAGDVRLLPGAAQAIQRLNSAGLLSIVVSNQSGIARRLLTEADYRRTEQRVDELVSENGGHLDAHYFCPHLPEVDGACECRKPGTLLYRQAAERFFIDLSRSWWVGDRLRDVVPAESLGGRGILVGTTEPDGAETHRFSRARDLSAAVEEILASLSDSPH